MLPESVFPGYLVAGGEGGDLDLEVLLHEDLGVCVLLGEEALGWAGAGAVPCVPVQHQAPGSEDAAPGHRVPLPVTGRRWDLWMDSLKNQGSKIIKCGPRRQYGVSQSKLTKSDQG